MTEPLTAPAPKPGFKDQIDSLQAEVEQALDRILPSEKTAPTALHQAMRYSVMGGGKRIRPVLVYASGLAMGIPLSHMHGPACAVELIHAYSLIHDDLPAMDNDDLRRGRPTCHKAFDEATAILAGDALQALAFEAILEDPLCADDDRSRIEMMRLLARAAGHAGMAGGQAIDLAAVNQQLDLEQLERMHRMKTGALIEASVMLPLTGHLHVRQQERDSLGRYARHIGLAFQIQDDILDAIGDTETLGKTQGSDMAQNKPTYFSLLGLQGARNKLNEAHREAIQSLRDFDEKADLLRQIADYIVERTH
ncbi:MAG TPA: farnesyl diphosphate synthase [Gammaproteobacteria bacterium]|jgi:farnesyl diphosphate synthase